MIDHAIQWVSPAPLWGLFTSTPTEMRRPTLLRFASDSFMQELVALMEKNPAGISAFLASKPEAGQPSPQGAMKLYQPAHGRFYLIATSLVCRLPGLPEHSVDPAREERAGFVIRRFVPAAGGNAAKEYAWVDAKSPKTGKEWRLVDKDGVAAGEEVLPLFPVLCTIGGLKRRVLCGLVPTTSSETYEAAQAASVAAASNDGDARLPANAAGDPRAIEAEDKIIASLTQLQSILASAPATTDQQASSRYLLLDLAELLAAHAPAVWSAIYTSGAVPASLPKGDALFDLLNAQKVGTGTAPTWRQALVTAWNQKASITGSSSAPPTLSVNLRNSPLKAAALKAPLAAAITETALPTTTTSEPVLVPKFGVRSGTQFVLRCIYTRPRCGALHDDVVSERSAPFTIASFFDSDAPTRPIRIPLPVDTSISGLRKFKRNVGVILSAELRRQASRATDLKKLIDGEVDEAPSGGGGDDLGEMWIFSLPIITLCALIVMMIFMSLLNIIFWWLPFLKIRVPIKLNSK